MMDVVERDMKNWMNHKKHIYTDIFNNSIYCTSESTNWTLLGVSHRLFSFGSPSYICSYTRMNSKDSAHPLLKNQRLNSIKVFFCILAISHSFILANHFFLTVSRWYISALFSWFTIIVLQVARSQSSDERTLRCVHRNARRHRHYILHSNVVYEYNYYYLYVVQFCTVDHRNRCCCCVCVCV